MARPLSEEKRRAVLESAIVEVSRLGVSAPTSLIAKEAGVSVGTLFRYFQSKEILLNELYLYLKRNLCEYLEGNYQSIKPIQERMHYLWDSHIDWGLNYPEKSSALNQLMVSDIISAETHEAALELFPYVDIDEAYNNSSVFRGLPRSFADEIFIALADATLKSSLKDRENAELYKSSGFSILCKVTEVK
ncbi:TetR/AcrR family transcriptional regulator [Raoultella terrigena]|uniref:TetR/AcrR family transcriptional regulator n=1 Tax=Raoultella terrigena TaxID=577 RepID=UPI00349F052B